MQEFVAIASVDILSEKWNQFNLLIIKIVCINMNYGYNINLSLHLNLCFLDYLIVFHRQIRLALFNQLQEWLYVSSTGYAKR